MRKLETTLGSVMCLSLCHWSVSCSCKVPSCSGADGFLVWNDVFYKQEPGQLIRNIGIVTRLRECGGRIRIQSKMSFRLLRSALVFTK